MNNSLLTRLCMPLLLAAASLVAPTAASAYSELVVFGDSLSDSGNNAIAFGTDPGQVITGNSYIPTLPYASGDYSNAAVWTASFAAGLGLTATPSLAGGGIYAYGGARTRTSPDGVPSLRDQVTSYLGTAGSADPDALYVVEGGGNNARDALEAIADGAPLLPTLVSNALQYAVDVKRMVDELKTAGAQHIVVWNTPDLSIAPAITSEGRQAVALAGIVTGSMNQALTRVLAAESSVVLFDNVALFDNVVAHPASYGLLNVTDACGAIAGCDPSTYLFWDGIHPTSAGHQIIADAMLQIAAVPEAGTASMLAVGVVLLIAWRRRQAR